MIVSEEINNAIKKNNSDMLLFGFVVGATLNDKISVAGAIIKYKSKFKIKTKNSTLERRYFFLASNYLSNLT